MSSPDPKGAGAAGESHNVPQTSSGFVRSDGRTAGQLRPFKIDRGYYPHAEGSVLIETGATRVLCAATVQETVPDWLAGRGKGWVTAEYGMLPRSTPKRVKREAGRSLGGRTQEIQRLIGRSLRAVTDLAALGERMVIIDCDVLQADGGTRTAAITGAFVALADALAGLAGQGAVERVPLVDYVAATSVGIVDGIPRLDLSYEEDVGAAVDMNVVMTGSGKYVEVQGTAEEHPFSQQELVELLSLAGSGVSQLISEQRRLLSLDLPGA